MLRIHKIFTKYPSTIKEAISLLDKNKNNATICAGGTDLIPNMKNELVAEGLVIGLSKINSLKKIKILKNEALIGPMVTLSDAIENRELGKRLPVLKRCLESIGSPQIKNMGTLGGNLCLDTRCKYYNQSFFWRESIGFCLKKDGNVCHVNKNGKRCVAISSNDAATILICLDSVIEISNSEKKTLVNIDDFFIQNGRKNNILKENEIVTNIRIPINANEKIINLIGFSKLRIRKSIDFPLLSIGARFDVNEKLEIKKSKMVINAISSRPKIMKTDWITGEKFNKNTVRKISKFCSSMCHPLENTTTDAKWIKEMIGVFTEKACEDAIKAY